MSTITRTDRRPKYLQIRDEVQRAIDAGEYTDGQKIPSETELAEEFKVSRPTVARALGDLEHDGLLQRRAGAGSFIRLKKHYTFGLLIREAGEIFEPICQGLAQAREGTPHELIWGNVSGRLSAAVQYERLCAQYIERKASGVFWAPSELTESNEEVNFHIAEALSRAAIPTVLLDRDICTAPQRSKFDLVGIDHRRAGYVVTEHLLQQGCKRIVFLARPHSAPTIDARIKGYCDAMQTLGATHNPGWIHFGDPQDSDFVRSFMRSDRPDGIVCANDFTAAQLMLTLSGLAIRVPERVKIVGIDDVKYASLVSVPLTTLRQPCRDIGVAALSAMLERIQHPDTPTRDILLDFKLIIRQSSGARL